MQNSDGNKPNYLCMHVNTTVHTHVESAERIKSTREKDEAATPS